MVFEYFYNPEKILKYRIERNPYYPFSLWKKNVFVLSFKTKRHVVGMIVCIVIAVVTVIVCVVMQQVTQYIIIAVFAFLYFLPRAFARRGKRILIIDMNERVYEVSGMRIWLGLFLVYDMLSSYAEPRLKQFLPLDEAIDSIAVIVIVSGSGGQADTLQGPAIK